MGLLDAGSDPGRRAGLAASTSGSVDGRFMAAPVRHDSGALLFLFSKN